MTRHAQFRQWCDRSEMTDAEIAALFGRQRQSIQRWKHTACPAWAIALTCLLRTQATLETYRSELGYAERLRP